MDEEIIRNFAEFQQQLEELLSKFQQLKSLSYDFYQENKKLKAENIKLKELVFNKKSEDKKAYSNLAHLYNEGYHICHLSFGETRKDNCLFCLQLIENQMEA